MDNRSIQTTQIRCLPDLESYLEAWRSLADGAPMRSPEWFLVWWKFYAAPEDELCVLLFHEPGGLLVGLAPLYVRVTGKRRTVCLLGSGAASTNHTTWLATSGWETRVSNAVAQFLLALEPGWNCVQLDSVDADDLPINATVSSMLEMGCLIRKKQRHNCWKIALPPTWEEYLLMLSRLHRKRCRKLKLLLESGRVSVHKVTSTADFKRGFEILLQLHSARWSEPDRPLGSFSDRRFRKFHETAALELLKRNQLLLVWLECDGRPIAAEYQFIDKKAVYSYLAGMDPSVTEIPPGNLSIVASILYAITEGCESFDLSRGDQSYKTHWRATPTATHDVRIWPNNLSGQLEHAMWGLNNLVETGNKQVIQWVKARVSPHVIGVWRRMYTAITGKRRGPHKMGSSQ